MADTLRRQVGIAVVVVVRMVVVDDVARAVIVAVTLVHLAEPLGWLLQPWFHVSVVVVRVVVLDAVVRAVVVVLVQGVNIIFVQQTCPQHVATAATVAMLQATSVIGRRPMGVLVVTVIGEVTASRRTSVSTDAQRFQQQLETGRRQLSVSAIGTAKLGQQAIDVGAANLVCGRQRLASHQAQQHSRHGRHVQNSHSHGKMSGMLQKQGDKALFISIVELCRPHCEIWQQLSKQAHFVQGVRKLFAPCLFDYNITVRSRNQQKFT